MRQFWSFLIGWVCIALLAALLYVPFLHNGFVFDDYGLFANGSVYDYVGKPFDFVPRSFPYFTLGILAVIYEGIEANRIFSLFLHIGCGWALYVLLKSLLQQTSGKNQEKKRQQTANAVPLIFTLWFVLNPIAVYGAGYLAQRTILFATLFTLLSLWFYQRAFAENRTTDIFTAALFYAMAVFSKEHAIMLPFATMAFTSLFQAESRLRVKRTTLYFVLCVPSAICVLLLKKQIVATAYEPDIATVVAQISDIGLLSSEIGKWFVSVVLQMQFFFKYFFFWIVPDVRQLSIDMRFDFSHIWFSWSLFPTAIFFCVSPLLAIYFLRKKGMVALFCCGYLYVWFLFLTELVSVRFQEPFVLYRSYLWAPGYAMMLMALCIRIPRRWLVIVAAGIFVIFFVSARERLTSLKSESVIWKDAAQKLESPTLPGSDRIFYNRGRAFLQEKQYDEAINDFSQAIRQNQKVSQIYYSRALAHYMKMEYEQALSDIDQALLLKNDDASTYYVRGLLLEKRGCISTAVSSYEHAMLLGSPVAEMKLEGLRHKKGQKTLANASDANCPV